MNDNELIEALERMKTGLISKATDGDMDEKEYKNLRSLLISNSKIKSCIPSIIKTSLTAAEFRRSIQAMYAHYSERRLFIAEEINKLINIIEDGNDSSLYILTGW